MRAVTVAGYGAPPDMGLDLLVSHLPSFCRRTQSGEEPDEHVSFTPSDTRVAGQDTPRAASGLRVDDS